MATVLGIQASFGDGSWATLGANFLSIGVAPIAITAGVQKLLKDQGQAAVVALSSFVSVVGGAFLLAVIMGALL